MEQSKDTSALALLRHTAANDGEIESYAYGVLAGTLISATQNVVGSLLVRIRELKETGRMKPTETGPGCFKCSWLGSEVYEYCGDCQAKLQEQQETANA